MSLPAGRSAKVMTPLLEENLFATVLKGSSALLLTLCSAALIFFSLPIALGVLAGGLVAIVNFIWIRSVLQRILIQLPVKASSYAQIRYVGRLAVTAFFLYFIITSSWFSLAGLFVGLSVIVITIIALSLYGALSAGG